jgi:hypothetical protein
LITGLNTKKNTYAFGMPMPGRNYQSSSGYRYGMNGQEADKEIFEGAYTAEYWEYDSRTGRRWNRDPVVKYFESPYACFSDNPIYYTDINGDDAEGWEPNKKGGYTYNPDPTKGTETADWTGGDINKVPYQVHGNKDGSLDVTFSAVDVRPEKTFEPSAQQKVIYGACNDFSKGCLIGAVALPSAVVAIETGFAAWALKTAGIITLEELAGIPTPAGTIEKQGLKETERLLLKAPSVLHKHHVLSQQFRSWFKSRGIENIDDYTVEISLQGHLRGVHGNGLGNMPGKWNTKWAEYIKANPSATPSEIFYQAETMLKEYGLEHLPYVPYK